MSVSGRAVSGLRWAAVLALAGAAFAARADGVDALPDMS